MTGKEAVRRAAPAGLPAGVAAGFVLLVWAAGSGPLDVFDASGRTRSPPRQPSPQEATGSAAPGPPALSEVTEDVEQTLDLSWLGDLIAWTIVLAVVFLVFSGLRWMWQHRWQPPPPAPEVEFEALPTRQLAEKLAEDAETRRAALVEGDARNGIVRCWVMLQQSIEDAGLPVLRAETSTEYAVRVLHALDLDPRAVEKLAGLYREARFSTHPLGEDARTAATAALDSLHDDLRAVGAR